MNARIQELVGQAKFAAEETLNKQISKNAELIVQECAQKLENDGMVEVAMELKEHFRVN